jgi:hypothetical protein
MVGAGGRSGGDVTASRASGAVDSTSGGEGEDWQELTGAPDLLDCMDCVSGGDTCDFHEGFAAGWDACAAFVARAARLPNGVCPTTCVSGVA